MSNQGIEVKGMPELIAKIKRLDDKLTRREVLKVQRRSAKPIVTAFKNELPVGNRSKTRFGTTYPAGTLRDSVAAETVPSSKVGGNPQIVVRPSTKGKRDGWYRFMVVRKGTKTGNTKRGSRTGKNTVVSNARNKVAAMRNALVTRDYEKKMTRLVQNQINRL